ncbi:MAG: alpha/beta hydrolase [Bacteroidales bacterium]
MRIKLYLLFWIMVSVAKSQSSFELPVWPNGAPMDNEIKVEEKVTPEGYIEFSKEAKLFVYLPDTAKNTHKTILICPGGGYRMLAIKHEGYDIAKWLASEGFTAVILKYRMPNHHSLIPLSDSQEAMAIIKRNAKKWNIDSNKIGVCGFSAGGHLASTLSTQAIDSLRPNFAILFYPVISMKEGIGHMGSRNNLLENKNDSVLINKFSNHLRVDAKTPRTLLILADDDAAVIPENSILYYQALKKEHIAASMRIFPSGSHGFGFRPSYKYHSEIKQIMLDWLNIKTK